MIKQMLKDRILTDKERKNLAILEVTRKNGPISRTDISKITELNIVTVSNYVSHYIKKGLVVEGDGLVVHAKSDDESAITPNSVIKNEIVSFEKFDNYIVVYEESEVEEVQDQLDAEQVELTPPETVDPVEQAVDKKFRAQFIGLFFVFYILQREPADKAQIGGHQGQGTRR